MGREMTPEFYAKDEQGELGRIRQRAGLREKDIRASQLEELAEIRFPSPAATKERRAFVRDTGASLEKESIFVYFPWRNTLLQTFNEAVFSEIKTNRNRLLITHEEQQVLRSSCIAVAGMSIGGAITTALAKSLTSKKFVIADNDIFSTTNLNRVPVSILDVDEPKVEVVARRIYEYDPFSDVSVFDQGINEDNIDKFFNHKPSVVVDAIDDFKMKIKLRQHAKKKKIPLIMFTNLGDGTLLDIERYDREETTPFNGLVDEDVIDAIIEGKMSPRDQVKFAVKLVGLENIPTRALESLTEIGKSLKGRPQLASTVIGTSGLAGFVIKKLLLGEELKSGRTMIAYEDLLSLKNDREDSQARKLVIDKINQILA